MLLITVITQGCSIMPYQEESSCKFNGLGKCLPIDKAYKEAVTDVDQGGIFVNGKIRNTKINAVNDKRAIDVNNGKSQNQLIYQKTQNLVNPIEVPLLKPAIVHRVFINSYKSADSKIWHEATNVYYIEQQPQWALDLVEKHKETQGSFNLF